LVFWPVLVLVLCNSIISSSFGLVWVLSQVFGPLLLIPCKFTSLLEVDYTTHIMLEEHAHVSPVSVPLLSKWTYNFKVNLEPYEPDHV
jgi:hypothetical protein